jgi:dipeptidase E
MSRSGLELESIHRADDARKAAEDASGYFIGGGNTFLLLKTLYEKNVMDVIKRRVLKV